MSKEWKERPSNLLGLAADPYISYCVDEAVYMFGRHVENEMNKAEEATKNNKQKVAARQRVLMNMLSEKTETTDQGEVAPPPPTKQFRDPATMFKSK